MNLPYLMSGYALAAILLLAGVYVARGAVPGLLGFGALQRSLVCALISVVLFGMRSHAPDWLTILCANGLLFCSMFLVYCATAEVLSVASRFRPIGVATFVSAEAGLAWFTYPHPSLLARILISSGVMIIYAISTAALLFRYREAEDLALPAGSNLSSQTLAVGVLQALNALDHLTRSVLSVLFPPASYVHMDMIQAGFTYINMLLNVGAICGVMWLALSVHRQALQRTARTDSMTGLLNRRAFEELLARDLQRAAFNSEPVLLMLLDIDHFKQVNDSLGHQAGDEVIRRLAAALTRSMRPSDILCRIGGEEFGFVLHGLSLETAHDTADRLRQEIAALERLPGHVRLTASLGVAASLRNDTCDTLIRRCDDALYASKRQGRNCVTVDHAKLVSSGPASEMPLPRTAMELRA